jgi:predicted pyridoxine 5'-phosphate oxidase superfamily flavin-nucleotide-binding protein
MNFTEITSEAELREVLGGFPAGRAVTKVRRQLHPTQIEWLKASPFCVLATSDAAGNCDASPKGDPAGHLVHVLDPRTVVIAERPGNKRADGYLNILANALVVEIDQVFSHCPKAFMRSELWEPESWKPDALPSIAALCKAAQDTPESVAELEEYYAPESYTKRLY